MITFTVVEQSLTHTQSIDRPIDKGWDWSWGAGLGKI